METEMPGENDKEMASTDLEWQQRVLCSDGNCIGVIGPDGRCKECGKAYDGSLPDDPISESSGSSTADSAFEEEDSSPDDVPSGESEYDDWQDRVLCSDGNCIGVIGPDGRCKECGKPFQMTNDEPLE